MNKRFLIISALLSVCALAQVTKAEREVVAQEALSLWLQFDGGCNADLATGRDTPTEIRGKASYAEGLSGQALVSGKEGACGIYECKGNLDFDHPGTITVWFHSQGDWHANPGPQVVLWGLGNDKGYIGMRISSIPKDVCLCKRKLELCIYHSTKRRNATYTLQPPALTRLCRGWHMVSFAWAGDQLFLSFDGAPYKANQLTTPLSNAEFAHCTRFAVGYQANAFLVDDFRIYTKKLTDDELLKLYETGLAK